MHLCSHAYCVMEYDVEIRGQLEVVDFVLSPCGSPPGINLLLPDLEAGALAQSPLAGFLRGAKDQTQVLMLDGKHFTQ